MLALGVVDSFSLPTLIQVEGEAQGEEATLKKFLKDVDNGPRHAHVVRLDKEDREVVDGEEGFVVRHRDSSVL